MVMELDLSSCENHVTEISSNINLFDLEYTDDVVLLNEDLSKLHIHLDYLPYSLSVFGRYFASSKYIRLWYDSMGWNPSLAATGEELETEDRFSYLGGS